MLILNDSLAEAVQGDTSAIWLSNCNAWLEPDLIRLMGARVEPDRQHITVYVPAKNGANLIDNFAVTDKVTFVTVLIFTYASYQLKGKYISHQASTAEDIACQRQYVDKFSDALTKQGLPKQPSFNAYFQQPGITVRMLVAEAYEQTPKTGTGGKISV